MPPATRVTLVPPAAWTEGELVEAARALAPPELPLRPGDALAELVVIAVEPAPGATPGKETQMELLPTPRRPDAREVDVAILLDASESMSLPWDAKHTRLEAALVASRSFLAKPGDAVADVSIYHYAKEPRLVAGPARADALKLPAPSSARGPSRTASALDAALADLAARTREDRSQVVLLFTDGVGDADELQRAAERARRLRIPVHTLVFAPEMDEMFHALASVTSGSAQQASYPLTIEFVHEAGG